MKINEIQEFWKDWDEEVLIDQEFEFMGQKGNFLLFVRKGFRLEGYLLVDEGEQDQRIENMRKRFQKERRGKLTNRQQLLANIKENHIPCLIHSLKGILYGGMTLSIESAIGGILRYDDIGKQIVYHSIQSRFLFGSLKKKKLRN